MGASVSQTGLGAPEGAEPSGLGATPAIPRAAEDRILLAVKRALEPLSQPLSWQEYYTRLQRTPDLVLHNIREAQVLFRLPEQANWPIVIQSFQSRPYTLTIRTQLTIAGQTFGLDQQMDETSIWMARDHRDLSAQMAKRTIRSVIEAVAEPYFGEAAVRFASAIEARRAETGTGSVHESAAREAGDAQ